jgi:SanA protein
MILQVTEVVKRMAVLLLACGVMGAATLGGLRQMLEGRARHRMYREIEQVPARSVALVLGAGLWPDGTLTPVLADRVTVAAELHHAGVVQKLLCSGDNRFVDYNEPQAMLTYAVGLGVPEQDIVLDYAGRRTYDSCYRAREIFGVEGAVVVTQRFHAARALYLCEALGVDAVAAISDRQAYSSRRVTWETREYLAVALAWWDVNVRRPIPVLGDPIPIWGAGTEDEIVMAEGIHRLSGGGRDEYDDG